MTLIIAGTLTVDPAHRDRMIEAAATMVTASRAEDGCLDYVFSPDPGDPAVVRLFEKWTDGDALAAHAASDHMAAWKAVAADLPFTGRDLTVYTVSGESPLG